jgi:acyl-CoA dehydrogenase
MADTLGALHRLDPRRIGLANFGGGKSKSDKSNATYSKRQLERWAGQYALSLTQVNGDMKPEPAMVALIEWLRFNCPLNEPDGRLVHGDYRLDNLVSLF